MKSERDVRDGHGELLDARDEGAPQDVLRILQAQSLRYCNDAGLQYTPQYSEVKRWFGDDPIIQNDIAAAVVNQRVADDNAKIIDASIGDWAKQDLPDCPGVNPGYYRHLASQFLNTNSGNIDIIYDMGIGDSVNRIPSSKAALTHFVEEIDADKIAQQMVDLARRMRPAFDAYAEALRTIKVSEISVGCAITAEAGLVFAGVGVEASMEITFDLT
jgi:Trypsin-co-occurring domain 1